MMKKPMNTLMPPPAAAKPVIKKKKKPSVAKVTKPKAKK